MKKFMDENFLLSNDTAINLFHNYAKNMPIIDYHCHISPKEIFENKSFKNITEAWLYGDHYKWRAMRSCGIDEKYITGDGSDYDKFMAWAKTVPMIIGNPLYHWTHLELQRYFGIYEVLNEKTAPAIWEKVNSLLNGDGFTVRDLIKKSKVQLICSTDDPIDTLEYHIKLKECNDFDVKVLPTFRPDKALGIEKDDFILWAKKLGQISNKAISNYDDFLEALKDRIRFFHSVGCRMSDHSLEYVPCFEASKEEIAEIFSGKMRSEAISLEKENKYKAYTLKFLGRIYSELGWTMQLHMNPIRNNNTRRYTELGSDTGFDSINDNRLAYSLSNFLDSLEEENALPKTILYSLNPNDNAVLGTLIGCFQGGGMLGKIQLGAAWWFNDNRDGIVEHLKVLANLGALGSFVGMLTDSRSFLSYTRHEYFRRILCDLIGRWVEAGEVPNDEELIGSIVKNISYYNANKYFGM